LYIRKCPECLDDVQCDLHKRVNMFTSEVISQLKWYVYRLIDPRNGETFYVGTGIGNRVFAHIRDEQGLDGDDLDNKIKRIREINNARFEVSHVIHRHGMDQKTARDVEAALIDAYPGLTNIMGGIGSNDFGVMHAEEIIRRYAAEPAVFEHKVLLINVNRSASQSSLYDATRYAWKINPDRAKRAKVILATLQGLIIGAFVAADWLPATALNFPGFGDALGRWGFVGQKVPDDIGRLYIGKRVPDKYRRRGAANPIKYNY